MLGNQKAVIADSTVILVYRQIPVHMKNAFHAHMYDCLHNM